MKKDLPKFPEVLLVIGHKTATAKTQTYVMFNQKPPESLAVSGLSPLIQFIQCCPFNISEAYFQSYYLPSLQTKSGLISQPSICTTIWFPYTFSREFLSCYSLLPHHTQWPDQTHASSWVPPFFAFGLLSMLFLPTPLSPFILEPYGPLSLAYVYPPP